MICIRYILHLCSKNINSKLDFDPRIENTDFLAKKNIWYELVEVQIFRLIKIDMN